MPPHSSPPFFIPDFNLNFRIEFKKCLRQDSEYSDPIARMDMEESILDTKPFQVSNDGTSKDMLFLICSYLKNHTPCADLTKQLISELVCIAIIVYFIINPKHMCIISSL